MKLGRGELSLFFFLNHTISTMLSETSFFIFSLTSMYLYEKFFN